MEFQQIVVIVAVVLLLVILFFIGLTLRYAQSAQPWIPAPQSCPDYWVMRDASDNLVLDGSGNLQDMYGNVLSTSNMASGGNGVCVNVKGLGTCKPINGEPYLVMDFNSSVYQGSNGDCAKYKWAQGCGVAWDGITYGLAKLPCDTSVPY